MDLTNRLLLRISYKGQLICFRILILVSTIQQGKIIYLLTYYVKFSQINNEESDEEESSLLGGRDNSPDRIGRGQGLMFAPLVGTVHSNE